MADDLQALKLDELRRRCEEANLPSDGPKRELVGRLRSLPRGEQTGEPKRRSDASTDAPAAKHPRSRPAAGWWWAADGGAGREWRPYAPAVSEALEACLAAGATRCDVGGEHYVDLTPMRRPGLPRSYSQLRHDDRTKVRAVVRSLDGTPDAPPPPPPAAAAAAAAAVRSAASGGGKKSSTSAGVLVRRFKSAGVAKEKTQVVKGRAAVDSSCPVAAECHVLEEAGKIFDAYLNQTDIANNRNKYYIIQLLEPDDHNGSYFVWNRWGRVGEERHAQNALRGPMALAKARKDFASKFWDKTRNKWEAREQFATVSGKYTLIERDYGVDEAAAEAPSAAHALVESKLDPRVQDFVRLVCDVKMMEASMREIGFDAQKLPLGKLKKATVLQAYRVLQQLSSLVGGASSGGASSAAAAASPHTVLQLSNQFYSLIPHVSYDEAGGTRARLPQIDNVHLLKQKIEMVEALGNIELSSRVITPAGAAGRLHPIDARYAELKTALKPVDVGSEAHQLLAQYIANTHAATHSEYTLELLQAFELSREGEGETFRDVGNRKLLWHGSRLSNWVGILSGGLRIAPPEAPVTGYMFGKGVYFADMVSKSANYCFANQANPVGVLLLCDVALGKQYERLSAEYEAGRSCRKRKCDSTFGKGKTAPDPRGEVPLPGGDGVRVPMGKGTSTGVTDSSLLYNEFIVYDTDQVRQKFVLKVKFHYV